MNSRYDNPTAVRVDVTMDCDEGAHRNSLLLNDVELARVVDALGRYCTRWGVSEFSGLGSLQRLKPFRAGFLAKAFAVSLECCPAGRRYPRVRATCRRAFRVSSSRT